MKKKIVYPMFIVLVLSLLAILVWAAVDFPLNQQNFGSSVLEASRTPGVYANLSGTTVNISFELAASDRLQLDNVSFQFQLISNDSLIPGGGLGVATNGSIMLNRTLSNFTLGNHSSINWANRTLWNFTLDTTVLLDGTYNITLFVANKTIGDGASVATGTILNVSFFVNVTIDNTPPVVTAGLRSGSTVNTSSLSGNGTDILLGPDSVPFIINIPYAADAETNITLNITVRDQVITTGGCCLKNSGTFTNVQQVIFQFENTTYFNNSATYNNSGTWGVSVNKSAFNVDLNPLKVRVFILDYAGATNSSVTFDLNVDKTLPTLSLTLDEATEESLKIKVATSSDAKTCTTTVGAITGTGAAREIRAEGLDADTSYTVKVTCSDEVGNSKTKTESFTTNAPSGGSAPGAAPSGGGVARPRATEPAAPGGGGGGAPGGQPSAPAAGGVTSPTAAEGSEASAEAEGVAREAEQEVIPVSAASRAVVWIVGVVVVLAAGWAYLAFRRKS